MHEQKDKMLMKRLSILIATAAALGLATSAYAATTQQQTPPVKAAKAKTSHLAAKNAKAKAKADKKKDATNS